jgi:hypothetical protein
LITQESRWVGRYSLCPLKGRAFLGRSALEEWLLDGRQLLLWLFGVCMSLLVCRLSYVCVGCACPCWSAACLMSVWGVHVLVGLPPVLCLCGVCMSLLVCRRHCVCLRCACPCWSAACLVSVWGVVCIFLLVCRLFLVSGGFRV